MKNILSWIEENKQQFEGDGPRNMAHGGIIIPPEKPGLPQIKIFVDKLKTYLNAGAIKKDFATQLLKDKMEELGVSDAELGTITGRRGEADGGRIGYDDGQLVRNTVDGSRPGYSGDYDMKELDAATEYYTNGEYTKFNDIKGFGHGKDEKFIKKYKNIRTLIKKQLDYHDGKFVTPGTE